MRTKNYGFAKLSIEGHTLKISPDKEYRCFEKSFADANKAGYYPSGDGGYLPQKQMQGFYVTIDNDLFEVLLDSDELEKREDFLKLYELLEKNMPIDVTINYFIEMLGDRIEHLQFSEWYMNSRSNECARILLKDLTQ